MLKRLLITVVLSMLILNLSVQAGIVIHYQNTASATSDPYGHHEPQTGQQDLPPMQEDARDNQVPESEDEFPCLYSGVITLVVPALGTYTLLHPEPNELEGACSCLLKPPAAADYLI